MAGKNRRVGMQARRQSFNGPGSPAFNLNLHGPGNPAPGPSFGGSFMSARPRKSGRR